MADATQAGSKTTITMPSEREVEATRLFDAPRQLVWDAHTKCEHVREWQLGPEGWTMPICEIDLRPGGKWRYGFSGPDGTQMEMTGEYREVVAPERLVNTENWGGDWPEAVDTLILTEEGGKTRLTATVVSPSKETRDAALATGMVEGWSQSYDRLEEYLERIK